MAYDTPFRFLTTGEEHYLVSTGHEADRTLYIDCLALLHDVLADFGTMSLHSVFTRAEIAKTAAESIVQFSRVAYLVKNNIEANMKTALDLYDELTSGARQVTRAVTLSYVDEYLDDLLKQYQAIRHAVVP